MTPAHPALEKLLQKAYSAERAAAFAYIGHAASLKAPEAKAAVKQIENDEWKHRENILGLLQRYGVPVSRWNEAHAPRVNPTARMPSCRRRRLSVRRTPNVRSRPVRRMSLLRSARMCSTVRAPNRRTIRIFNTTTTNDRP